MPLRYVPAPPTPSPTAAEGVGLKYDGREGC